MKTPHTLASPRSNDRLRPNRRAIVAASVLTAGGATALVWPSIASGSARSTVGSGVSQLPVQRPLLATLNGTQEVPGPGDSDGSGAAAVTVDSTTGEICVDLRAANIATATAAHIHRGALGVAGPVEMTLTAPASGTSATCVTAAPTLAAEIATTPEAFYVNVHNAEFTNGAVRGQLAPSTARVGSMQLLAEPLRAYDSRLGNAGPITAGTTRTIALATGVDGAGNVRVAVPPGAVGALVRLTLTDSVGAGFLRLYSAALTSEPQTSAANWYQSNAIVGSDATVAVDAEGRVKVTARENTTHFVLDVVGYVF